MTSTRKRRGNSRNYAYVIVGMLLLIAFSFAIYRTIISIPWFNLKSFKVVNNERVPSSVLEKHIRQHFGENIFHISIASLKKRIGSTHRIKELKIRRHLPNSLTLILKERRSFMYIKSLDGELFPIDEEAIVLENFYPYHPDDIPVLSVFLSKEELVPGRKIDKAQVITAIKMHKQICEQAPEFEERVSEYYFVGKTPLMVDAKYGACIIPDPAELIPQLKRYIFVQENGAIDHGAVFDLRYRDQVVVKAGN